MKFIPLDIEAIGLEPYKGVVWIVSLGNKVYHDYNGLKTLPQEARDILADETVCKIIHNGLYDIPYSEMNLAGVTIRNIWDTMQAEVVIQGTQIPRGSSDEGLKKKHSSALEWVLPRYGFKRPDKSIRSRFIDRPRGIPFAKAEISYAQGDTANLPAIQRAQEYLLKRDGGLEVALLENKVTEVVAGMVKRGLRVDPVLWREIADQNLQKYKRLIAALPKQVSNWNSPKQVKQYFQDRGVLIPTFKQLDNIQAECKDRVLGKFIEARNLYSNATSYGSEWLLNNNADSIIDGDGRVRCSWQQQLNTGRFSTSNPNLLALPKEGNQRAAIIPAKGCVFVIGDYSGQEIGIMAAASEEEQWINALLRGESVHSLVASQLFPAEWEQGVTKGCTFPKKCKCPGHQDMPGLPYYKAKKLNFMLAYGGGAGKFAEITGCEELLARVIIKKYKKLIPNITQWLEKNARDAIATGVTYSADPYRRRFVLKGLEDWEIGNQGKNYPVQGPGANMLKLAMISMPAFAPIVLPFHDELVVEPLRKDAVKAQKAMKKVMEDSAAYITGIKGLIKVEPKIAMNFAKQAA